MSSSHPYAVLSLEHRRQIEAASRRRHVKLIIVDSDVRVVFNSFEPNDEDLLMLLGEDRRRFRSEIAHLVSTLIDECTRADDGHSRMAFLDMHRYIRIARLEGSKEASFAVSVEYFRNSDSLSRAARKYQLTLREIDVLDMILKGASAMETARALKIAEATVQGYYKRLLSKTQSRNRPAMVANVLEWSGSDRRGAKTVRG